MRLWAILSAALFFLMLLLARFLPEPYWRVALYPLPLLLTSTAVACAAVVLELQLGPHFRSVAPLIAAALGLFCLLFAIFERPPGTLVAGMMLENLPEKAVSIAALGAGFCALVLAIHGARSPSRLSQAVALVAVVMVGVALGMTARAIGLPTLSATTLVLVGLAGLLYLVSLGPARPREEPASEQAQGPADEPGR